MNEEEKKITGGIDISKTIESNIDYWRNKCFEQQKEIEKRFKEIDSLYKMMSAKDDEIEKLKEDYQILKDDIEVHNITYVDTPEFEEKYISKDKIKEIKEEYEKERSNMTQIIFSKYGKTQQTFKQAVYNEVIKVLNELIGEPNE